MKSQLPSALVTVPLAHRALHDISQGRPENSRAAISAAVEAGYGIEIDIQPSSDGVAMVFHDDHLDRLTNAAGLTKERSVAELCRMQLMGTAETIPTLADVLDYVGGRVPILIEIKDQDGAMGQSVGKLEAAVAKDLESYTGAVAVMSFNPHSVAAMAELSPGIPRGITTSDFRGLYWNPLTKARRAELRQISDFEKVGATFISHNVNDLDSPHVAKMASKGAAILCWTVRSAAQEAKARLVADNITFEGYAADLDAG